MADKQQAVGLTITGDLDALSKLFAANQYVDQTTREEREAKTARKAAEEYRDTLLSHLDAYTAHRKEQVASQLALGEGFLTEPMPPWMSPGQDPDKPDEGTQPGAS